MAYQVLEINGNTASFTMPETDTTVYADFISIVWDGTIDLTWYDADAMTINIRYPAQLEGAAALTAGLFNDIPTREVEVSDGKTAYSPDISDDDGNVIGLSEKSKVGTVSSNDGSGYQTFADIDGDGIETTVVGDLSLLRIHHNSGEVGTNNQVTSDIYWYGNEDFTGKKIRLETDLDMGGVLKNGVLKTVMSSWSGPNYMPLGGQYSMDRNNGYTRLTAGFNGSFDGQGHMVYNIYVSRHADTFGNCQSVGLIGLLGIYRVENGTMSKPVIENVAIDGFIHGNRSIGGIVGKTVHAKGSVIRNCVNFATIYNTDAKGCGGIVGAAWFDASFGDSQPQISNCANLGLVCTGYNKNAGGLVGSNESMVFDSYTIGYATGEGKNNDSAGQSLGTNNGGAVWYNCYTLEAAGSGKGTTPGSDTQQVYNSTYGSAIRVLADVAAMKGAVNLLNGKVKNNGPDENGYMDSDDDVIKNTKRNWVEGTNTGSKQFISSNMLSSLRSIVSWRNPQTNWPDGSNKDTPSSEFTLDSIAARLTAVDGEGLPIPRTFFNDSSSVEVIKTTGTPTKDYLTGETFDTGDHSNQSEGPNDTDENSEFSVWAVFDDGTYQEIEDYSVTYEGGKTEFTNTTDDNTTTTSVIVSGTYLGREFRFEIDGINVTKSDLLSLDVTALPNNQFYCKGEAFDPEGLVLSEDYGIKGGNGSSNDVRMTIKASYKDGQINITKRIKEPGSSEYKEFKLTGEATSAFVYIFDEDMNSLEVGKTKIDVSHTFNGEMLTASIPITVLSSAAPKLRKDGENNKQIVYIASADDFKWFANQVATGLDTGMDAILESDIQIGGSDYYPVGTRLVKGSEKSNVYQGIFDGKGHTITVNIDRGYKSAGLFYDMDENGSIRDLTIEGTITGGSKTGAFAEYMSGGTIKDCINNANITGKSDNVGGFVGNIRGEGVISGCINKGSVKGTDGVGGIAGNVSSLGTINKCVNTGYILSESTSTPAIGGIVGVASDGTIDNSRNSGIVSGKGESRLGGLVGFINSNSVVITNSYNQGSIIGAETTSAAVIGGIAGLINSNYKKSTISNCYNSGIIYCSTDYTNVGTFIGKTGGFSNITNNFTLNDPDLESAIVATSGTPADNNAAILSSAELISTGAASLGEAYASSKGTFPILAWEKADTVTGDLAKSDAVLKDMVAASDKAFTELIIKRLESRTNQLSTEYASSSSAAETAAAGHEAVESAQAAYGCALMFWTAAEQLSEIVDVSKDRIDDPEEAINTAGNLLTSAGDALGNAEALLANAMKDAVKTFDIKLSKTAYTYNGKACVPAVTVMNGNEEIPEDNYTVAYANNVKAGKATVTVSLKGDYYEGTKTINFTINKANNTLVTSGKTATVKFKTLKKKNQTLARTKVLNVSKNQGTVTFVKTSGNKKITINKTSGKVTVKKKLKKGTYSVKVRVTAAGNVNYKSLSTVVTFKVKVK